MFVGSTLRSVPLFTYLMRQSGSTRLITYLMRQSGSKRLTYNLHFVSSPISRTKFSCANLTLFALMSTPSTRSNTSYLPRQQETTLQNEIRLETFRPWPHPTSSAIVPEVSAQHNPQYLEKSPCSPQAVAAKCFCSQDWSRDLDGCPCPPSVEHLFRTFTVSTGPAPFKRTMSSACSRNHVSSPFQQLTNVDGFKTSGH